MERDEQEIASRVAAGERLAVATVVRTWRSAPRPAGASMAVAADGTAIGSISGGCVEGAVYTAALEVLETGEPQLCRYGVSDDDAFGVGLTCGGTIEVLVELATRHAWAHLEPLAEAREAGRPAVLATVVEGEHVASHLLVDADGHVGTLGTAGLDAAVADQARALLGGGPAGVARFDDAAVFLQPFVPKPQLLVLGAIDFASALCRLGKMTGHYVVVCDARAVFTTPERFPDADEVVVDWPHRLLERTAIRPSTAICVLTHDHKYDVPALEVALRSPAAYVGAMGSRRTHERRLGLLRDAGLAPSELARLRSPIGLDLGASSPEETAVAIIAEVLAVRHGAEARPLRDLSGPIHAHATGAVLTAC
ncbi:MAG: XdhC family protein [Acidimicrobiales bacterium]